MGQYNFGGNGNSLVVRHYVTMCAALCCSPPYSARSWQANPRPLPPSQESGLACSSSTSQQQHAAATTQHPACSSLQPHPQTLLSWWRLKFKIQFEHCCKPPPLSTCQLSKTWKRSLFARMQHLAPCSPAATPLARWNCQRSKFRGLL